MPVRDLVDVALQGDHLGMVQQPVKSAVANTSSPKRTPHSEKGAVTGEHNRRLFITSGHQVKSNWAWVTVRPQIAHLVNHQQLGTQIPPTLLAPTGGFEFLGQLPQGRKQDGITPL